MKITSINQIKDLIKYPLLSRKIHTNFYQHISHEKEVTILLGSRQIGKSQEIYKCIKDLISQNPADIFFYNLDNIPDEFDTPEVFLSTITAQKTDLDRKTYIFLDEAQRLPNVGLFVKYLYDQNKNIKFILTGSASLDIKAKIKEPLTGRKKEFFLSPLTLNEILNFRGIKSSQITSNFPLLEKILDEYLLFGGYPEVVILESKQKKTEKISEIANSYIVRDISAFFDFSTTKTIQLVSRFLAESIGNILSKESISKIGDITKYQTEKALEALEKSFIIKLLPPLAKKPSKELIHRPKVFFQDTGIRNAILGKLEPTLITADKGQLFENAVATELMSIYGIDALRFWRTTNQTEVDFVIIKSNGKANAIEAKYQWADKKTLPKNLQSLKRNYPDLIEEIEVISKTNFWKLHE
ncbi:hypothetical protein A2627_02545 [Candidatus Woesebacteria bacterium RIFCSPHIGHO2_01_FULL_39_28]|uniref:ATPase n=1 Tax=Candidatus Woesebacteria bacterium RIFCSPHIGHO2_01_FULL_39_28 TaxID=1802496 RepID=A0A1F7YI48_9BACT|nr:MAG: hypothetical protein A2627_02545 [Candidatus Woesebacteria bacterium RIFCSPHIGHO2_01_FULL_39_28]OGM57207.1 MAG: hypothetical protein A3A50_03405 [Candidatus Woesebacteria bacterium RIFCSPLOWO2_01_FULL_38_20]